MRKNITADFLTSISVLALFLTVVFPAVEAGRAAAQAATSTGTGSGAVQITVRQQIAAEISLTVSNIGITMSPSIPGMTGGTGNGSTTVKIITGNAAGYTVTIQASGTKAMNGEAQGGAFNDYPTTTPQTWVAASAGQSSRFGFGITNLTVSGTGNTATGYTTCASSDSCFASMPTTTSAASARPIVISNSDTSASGDSIDLKFRAQVPANPNPLMPQDWYTATATITALTN
jgi:hypothetical protein